MAFHRRRRNNRDERKNNDFIANTQEIPNETSFPFKSMFTKFQKELDDRNDKYERLIKLSRDITIESKRLIFQLHRLDSVENQEEELSDVKQKVQRLNESKWYRVAEELLNEDPYQYIRAYSPGLQEYIEAVSFLHYMERKSLIDYKTIVKDLQFPLRTRDFGQYSFGKKSSDQYSESSDSPAAKSRAPMTSNDLADSNLVKDLNLVDKGKCVDAMELSDNPELMDQSTNETIVSVCVPPVEYILGVADLTGELMRFAINGLGQDETGRLTYDISSFIRTIETALTSISPQSHREIYRKLAVLRQSARKVEAACYALKVRGSEVPKHLLAHDINYDAQATGRITCEEEYFDLPSF